MKKRILSMLMVLCMVFTLLPGTVFGTEGNLPPGTSSITGSVKTVCENHKEHKVNGGEADREGPLGDDDDCGYMEAVEGEACSHLNEDGTYSCAPVRDSGVASPSVPEKAYACDHDDACGYTKAVKEKPCTHVCELCNLAEKPMLFTGTRAADVVNNDYAFVADTGALTIKTNAGTTAWRKDTGIVGSGKPDYTVVHSVTIESGVTSIGNSAFASCSGLTSITIPESVISIGEFAFESCSGLTSIAIPQNVTSIGQCAFQLCSTLEAITIPKGVTSIGESTFFGCIKLETITFAEGSQLATIAFQAFASCSSLTSITIPVGVTSIGGSAFHSCSGLTTVTIPASVTSIKSAAFILCSSLTSITIPEGVTSIEVSTFRGCTSLTSITIPEGVATIEEYAFDGCSNLAEVICKPATPPTLGTNVFDSTASSLKIKVPDASEADYKAAQNWSTWAGKIEADTPKGIKITSPLLFNNSTATQNCTNTEAGARFHTNHPHANGRPCWAWNRDTATLTLDGVDIEVNDKDQSAISSQVAEMTITLAAGSENTVVNKDGGYITLYSSGNFTMNGSGKLTVISNTGEGFEAVRADGNIMIDGATVDVNHTGATTSEYAIGQGIYASQITIQNHAVVTVSGDTAINSSSDLIIKASTVTATSLKFGGIGVVNAVTVEDSTVTVVGGPRGDGIRGGTIHLKGSGTVTVTAVSGNKPFSKEPILTGMEHDDTTGAWDNTTGLACTYKTGSTPTHTHGWASAWSNDSSYHWHNCTGIGSCDITANSGKAGYAAHNYENSSDTSCNTCDYVRTIDNGGGGGGSSSGGGSPNTTVTPPPQDQPNTPTQGEIKLEGKVEDGNATIGITDEKITEAFDKALADAKKKGSEQNGITLVLSVSTGGKAVNTVTVNLPKTVQDTIIAKKIVSTVVVVDQPDIVIGMDLKTVIEINKQAQADVNITATRVDSDTLTGNAKTAVGSRPVFDLRVNTASGNAVQSFGTGTVSVTIPYSLAANESPGNVQAVYVDGTENLKWITGSVYDSVNKVLYFSTNHFSTYGVGYKTDAPALTDKDNHWAKDDIQFVVNRGLLAGTSATTFSPDTAMTKGMFVTALGRLANADVSGYKQSSFSDVAADSDYMGYIEWAVKNGIISGETDGRFNPDASITREQMAVIMGNYVKAVGYATPKVHAEHTFADSTKISDYAKASVKQMQMAGVLSGKRGNNFDPQGTATRAEASAVLRRFVELTISSDAMQGWTMNDSGQWMYYQDGKPVTGKKDINGGGYTFDQNGVME